MTRRFFGYLVLAAVGAGLLTPPLPSAEPGSRSPSGTVRLPAGLTAHYDYHYDRNALRDARRAGDAIIALTESGNLLRLDLATLKPTHEWFGPVPVACLGRGENDAILAGFEDGHVCQIDPATLALTEIARLSSKPRWVEAVTDGAPEPGKSRLVAVVDQTRPVERNGRRFPIRFSVVQDLGSSKTFALDSMTKEGRDNGPVAFLVDRKGRLWLAADNGEWGGWCAYVDFQEGKLHAVSGLEEDEDNKEKSWSGVYGFTELRDGQVWAYGGTLHMGLVEAFIGRVDRGQGEGLFRLQYFSDDKPPPADRPRMPVTHVIEDSKTGVIRVVSFSDIFRTDSRLANWAKVHELKIGYRWGRPDAMGSYPSVRSVLPVSGPGKPEGLLFVTRMNGFIRLADGQEIHHPVAAGQLEDEYVGRIENSAEGLLADGRRFRDGAWSLVSFSPPYEPHPEAMDAQQIPRPEAWYETTVLLDRSRAIFTINSTGGAPGTRTTARWRDGKAEVLGREVSDLNPPSCFLTPDGQLWNTSSQATRQLADGQWEWDEVLRRFADGRWVEAARFPELHGIGRGGWIGIGWGLCAVNDAGPPWTLLDARNQLLLRLAYAPNFKGPRMSVVTLTEGGKPLEVRDAIPWTKSELLLATDQGLKILTLDGDKLTASPINTGGRSIARLCRDGRGRLWLGGDGLAVVEAGGKASIPLDNLPMLGRATINALAADPAHPDGVVTALSGRGVVFVRVNEN